MFACAIWIFYLVDDTINEQKNEIEFIKNEINDSRKFIEEFKIKFNKLPNTREFYTWQREFYNDYSCDLNQINESLISGQCRIEYVRYSDPIPINLRNKFKTIDFNKEYTIEIQRDKYLCFESYHSWNNSYETNNFLFDLIFGIIIILLISIIPYLYFRNKSKIKYQIFFTATNKLP